MSETKQIIGLIPAAGKASRMENLPFSKELLPLVNSSSIDTSRVEYPRVAIDNALETITSAGIDDTCIVIAPGKWDIPNHTGSGERYGQHLAFVVVEESPSVPASLASARFVIQRREVAMVFPDIVFEPRWALKEIIEHRRQEDVDLVLALVPAANGDKIDIVTVTKNGSVTQVTPKPGRDRHGWTWVAATWSHRFTSYLETTFRALEATAADTFKRELYVADLINAAIEAGYRVRSVSYPHGISYDLGTPDELRDFWNSDLK